MTDNEGWRAPVLHESPRGDGHPLGARKPPSGSLHEQNEIAHVAKRIADELRERARRGFAILDQLEQEAR